MYIRSIGGGNRIGLIPIERSELARLQGEAYVNAANPGGGQHKRGVGCQKCVSRAEIILGSRTLFPISYQLQAPAHNTSKDNVEQNLATYRLALRRMQCHYREQAGESRR